MKTKLKTRIIFIACTTVFLITSNLQAAFASDERPIFALITAEQSCTVCQQLKPIVEELKNEFSGRVNFITLDISSKDGLQQSRQTAEDKGISKFFEDNKGLVPKVGILCPGGSKTEKLFTGEIRKEAYEQALNFILFDTTTLCSL